MNYHPLSWKNPWGIGN